MYDLTIDAFNLAEQYRVPVFLMGEEALGHLRERVELKTALTVFDREKKKGGPPFGTEQDDGIPPMPAFGEGEKLLVTGSTHNERGIRKTDDPEAHERLVTRINKKIVNHRDKIIRTDSYHLEDAELVIVCCGFTARSALFAVEELRKEGKKVGLLRLKTIWPFADRIVRDVSSTAKKLLVPEMNRGQLMGEVMKYAGCEVIPYHQTDGEIIHPQRIIQEARRLV